MRSCTRIYVAGMFAIWALIHSYFIDKDAAKALRNRVRPTLKEKLEVLPRILPFLAIIAGVLYVFMEELQHHLRHLE